MDFPPPFLLLLNFLPFSLGHFLTSPSYPPLCSVAWVTDGDPQLRTKGYSDGSQLWSHTNPVCLKSRCTLLQEAQSTFNHWMFFFRFINIMYWLWIGMIFLTQSACACACEIANAHLPVGGYPLEGHLNHCLEKTYHWIVFWKELVQHRGWNTKTLWKLNDFKEKPALCFIRCKTLSLCVSSAALYQG